MWPSWAFRPNELYGFRGRTGLSYVNRNPRTLSNTRGGEDYIRAQELCESRGGRPGFSSLVVLMVSVDVKQL